jgi:ABC-2 type transport system permease protein
MKYLQIIYHIAGWEYLTRLKSRSFIFLTVLLPVIVIILFLFPLQLKKNSPHDLVKLIGLINLNEVKLVEHVQRHVNQHYSLDSGSPGYIFMPVSLDESVQYIAMNKKYQALKARKDSIDQIYEKIIRTRSDYYKNYSSKEKEKLLERTYQDLLEVRDSKSQIEVEYFTLQDMLDSLHTRESKRIADSLLHNDIINAYLIIPEDFNEDTKLKYYSLNPDDLSEARKIQKILSEVIVKLKLAGAGIEERLIEEWLKPIRLEKVQIREGILRKDIYFQFNTIMISVIFLLLSVFTAGGFLLSSVFKEKSDNTLEFILSKATGRQVLMGKVAGFCALGLTQVLVWTVLTGTLLQLKLFPLVSIIFSNPNIYLYFILIYLSGYIFYAALYIILGTHVVSENEIQRINTVGPVLIFLIILLFSLIPGELEPRIVTYLLFFPGLAPFLVIIVLIKNGLQSLNDLYLQGIANLIVTLMMIYLADRSFKNILFRIKGKYGKEKVKG